GPASAAAARAIAARQEWRAMPVIRPPAASRIVWASERPGSLPELGAEAVAQRADDPVAQAPRVLVRERPLRRLEGEGDRDRLLSRRDLIAAVDVEDARLAQDRARRRARDLDQLADRLPLFDDDGDVLLDRGIRDHVLV